MKNDSSPGTSLEVVYILNLTKCIAGCLTILLWVQRERGTVRDILINVVTAQKREFGSHLSVLKLTES